MVVAAVISLQDPLGSGPDKICTWIEVHQCHMNLLVCLQVVKPQMGQS